jgi:hypothetical protein
MKGGVDNYILIMQIRITKERIPNDFTPRRRYYDVEKNFKF